MTAARDDTAGVTLGEAVRRIHRPFFNDYDGHLPRDSYETCREDGKRYPCPTIRALAAIDIARTDAETQAEAAALCSQCGDRYGVMLKIGTDDIWCLMCLDEAAETRVEATLDEAERRIRQRGAAVSSGLRSERKAQDRFSHYLDAAAVVRKVREALALDSEASTKTREKGKM